MSKEFLINHIIGYYNLLKKTGHESLCTTKELVAGILLVDMTTGPLSYFATPETSALVSTYIKSIY